MDKCLILYVYIYRNILNTADGRKIIDSSTLRFALNKVIRRSPACVFRAIESELEELKMVRKIYKDRYLVIENKKLNSKIDKLIENAFPIKF